MTWFYTILRSVFVVLGGIALASALMLAGEQACTAGVLGAASVACLVGAVASSRMRHEPDGRTDSPD